MSDLTAKQQRFVEEYLVDLNATQAAIRAGYSEKTAGQVGHENLKKPEIAAAIQVGREKLAERAGITADRVLEEVTRLALSDLRHVMRWGGTVAVQGDEGVEARTDIALIPSDELTDFAAASIAEVKQTKEGLAIKLHDKGSALDKLMKHLGLFKPERVEHSGPDGKPIETRDMTETEIARRLAFALAKGKRAAEAAQKDSTHGK